MNIDMKSALRILKALGDRNRLRILKMLQHHDGLCVCEMMSVLNVVQSTTSTHLKNLEDADLIYSEKEGKWVNFHLNLHSSNPGIIEVLGMLSNWLEDDSQVRSDSDALSGINRCEICGTREC